jgi:hypothetical protein
MRLFSLTMHPSFKK